MGNQSHATARAVGRTAGLAQGKAKEAQKDFKILVQLEPQSSVLLCLHSAATDPPMALRGPYTLIATPSARR